MCLIHFDNDIRLSTYIMYYCRMIGVYVYEIPTKLEDPINGYSDELDNQVVIVNQSMTLDWVRDNTRNDSICLVSEDLFTSMKFDLGDSTSDRHLIQFGQTDSTNNILKKLIMGLSVKYEEFAKDELSLLELVDIYDRNYILETILGTRFALAERDGIDRLCRNYENAINDIIANTLVNTGNKFAGFAMGYLAYEYDYYCRRLDRMFLYMQHSIIETMTRLQKLDNNWTSLDLLFAQVYDDLLDDIHTAYDYYIDASKKNYCAFTWYKMGNIWKNKYEEPDVAIRYYRNAVDISHSYYRAIFKIAECYVDMWDMDGAKKSYESLMDTLSLRTMKGLLSPVELEYLFKTFVNLGKIEWGYSENAYKALEKFQNAKSLWDEYFMNTHRRRFAEIMTNDQLKDDVQVERAKKFESEIDYQFDTLEKTLGIDTIEEWIDTMNTCIQEYDTRLRYTIEKIYSKNR